MHCLYKNINHDPITETKVKLFHYVMNPCSLESFALLFIFPFYCTYQDCTDDNVAKKLHSGLFQRKRLTFSLKHINIMFKIFGAEPFY